MGDKVESFLLWAEEQRKKSVAVIGPTADVGDQRWEQMEVWHLHLIVTINIEFPNIKDGVIQNLIKMGISESDWGRFVQQFWKETWKDTFHKKKAINPQEAVQSFLSGWKDKPFQTDPQNRYILQKKGMCFYSLLLSHSTGIYCAVVLSEQSCLHLKMPVSHFFLWHIHF